MRADAGQRPGELPPIWRFFAAVKLVIGGLLNRLRRLGTPG
jgi:hypothetical protein